MRPAFAAQTPVAIPIQIVGKDDLANWCAQAPVHWQAWIEACGFRAALGETLRLPAGDGSVEAVICGWGSPDDHKRGRFAFAKVASALKSGTYRLVTELPRDALTEAALGWLLAGYGFTRYSSGAQAGAKLVAPEGIDAAELEHIAAAEFLTRDLINTPANDMGPAALQSAVEELGAPFGAEVNTIIGDDLLKQNFPLIHTVGRASTQAPRLIELNWGNTGPDLCLVGKGVCFDTGGLNLKPGNSMGLMKKDMGGAANVLGLTHMIMSAGLNVKLRVLIPAVENAVSGTAFRPGDILTARDGQTVEINNTDAEGRLVLADALALADETPPDVLISMATLTGAARVAVGPDLAPFYTDDAGFTSALTAAASKVADPVWQMPFHRPYEMMIEPGIADLDNAPAGGFAGSITAALFLDRFVKKAECYTHFDIYGWCPKPLPGRPKGGVGQGIRAVYAALPEVLGL